MAINLKLSPVRHIDPETEPWRRSWLGWDARRTDEELWEQNRGIWALSPTKVEVEHFATLSYDGRRRIAAELTGHELVYDPRRQRNYVILVGNVLAPGDPVRDALVGKPDWPGRNPVTYYDTSALERTPHIAAAPSEKDSTAGLDVLDRLVRMMTVDAYDTYEQITAFHTVFEEEAALPAGATVVGVPVLVTEVDIRSNGTELTAHCRHHDVRQEISLADLVFPPDTTAAWVHAAYRRYLGLEPFPAAIPGGWQPDWL
jgi:hypothetical protein